MNKILTCEELAFFNLEGYLIIRNYLTNEELNKCINIFDSAFEKKLWKNSMYDSKKNINNIYDYFPELVPILYKKKYFDIINDILGVNLVCIPECTLHKNRYYDWHKDTTAMEAHNQNIHLNTDQFLLKCAFYFQSNNLDGGGVTLIPRTNKTKDPFVNMHYGSIYHRIINKFLKIIKLSIFDRCDKNKNTIHIMNSPTDLVIFNNQLFHRASFKRGILGNPIESKHNKYSIFNTFGVPGILAKTYISNRKNLNFLYSIFLKNSNHPISLLNRLNEFNVEVYH